MIRFFIRLSGWQLLLLFAIVPVCLVLIFVLLVIYGARQNSDKLAEYFIMGGLRLAGAFIILQGLLRWMWWQSIVKYLYSVLPDKKVIDFKKYRVAQIIGAIVWLVWGLAFLTGYIIFLVIFPWMFIILFASAVLFLIFYFSGGKKYALYPYKAVKAILKNIPYESADVYEFSYYPFARLRWRWELQNDVREVYRRYGWKTSSSYPSP